MREQIRPNLLAYIAGILRNLAAFKYMFVASSEPVIVNAVSDHVHILLTVPVTVALADIMRVLKAKRRDGFAGLHRRLLGTRAVRRLA